MEVVSHQNVKLERGRHSGPAQGVCLLELCSMLAEERFSDHPQSVCPMIGAYMRAVNDYVDDDGRHQLLPYGPALVGTAGSSRQARARLALCSRCALESGEATRRRLVFLGWAESYSRIGELCAKAALRRGLPQALVLADALLETAGSRVESPASMFDGIGEAGRPMAKWRS